jgi:hypothetical protein
MEETTTCPNCGHEVAVPEDVAHDAKMWTDLKAREAQRKRDGRAVNKSYAQGSKRKKGSA